MAWVSIKLSPIQNYESSPKKVRHSELVRWLCVWGEFRGPQTSDSDGTSRKNLLPRLEPPDSQKFGESLIAWRCPSHMPPGSSARGHPGTKRHSTHQRWSRLWQPKQSSTAACAAHRPYGQPNHRGMCCAPLLRSCSGSGTRRSPGRCPAASPAAAPPHSRVWSPSNWIPKHRCPLKK